MDDAPPTTDTHTRLADLLPPGAVGILSLTPTSGTLYAEESTAARHFAPGRLREFRHGRDCARAALGALGAGMPAIPVGDCRQPLWPGGVVGSISHCGEAAAAIVAWERMIAGLGVDLEVDGPLETALVERICIAEEIAAARHASLPVSWHARRIFSMKEAAYKALWPKLRQFLDFHDIAVAPGGEHGTFTVCSPTGKCPDELLARLHGRQALRGTLLISVAAIRP